jgi:hypothetical protein
MFIVGVAQQPHRTPPGSRLPTIPVPIVSDIRPKVWNICPDKCSFFGSGHYYGSTTLSGA